MSWEILNLGDIANIDWGNTKLTKSSYIDNGKYIAVSAAGMDGRINHFEHNEETIVISAIGANCGVVFFPGQKFTAIKNTITVTPTSKVLGKYLYWFFSTNVFKRRGAGQPFLSKTDTELIKIPLPPLATQKRIAEILDAADALKRKDQQLLKKYDELAQAIFIDMFGDPVKNEKGWEVKKLGELGNWKSGGTPSRINSDFFKGNIPWLTSGELNNIFISESKQHINKIAIEKSSTSLIEIDSILLGMYDTAALKSSINKIPLCCNQAIAFSKLNNKICNTIFVYYYIQLNKEELRKEQRGVRQKNMNLTMIKNLPIISPPKKHQDKFAELFQKIILQKELVKNNGLFQTLIQKAFNGELVN